MLVSELGFITFFLSQALSFSVCRSSEALVWLWHATQLALLCGSEQDPCTFPIASSEFSVSAQLVAGHSLHPAS